MFPPLDTNGFDSFSPHQTSMLPSFTTHIQNPSSHPLPLFSPAFLDESCFMNQFLLQQQDAEASLVETSENVCKKEKERCGDGTTVPKTRMGKKRDRHSKICTAKGPRDRRMRLSLQIARKFFDLQDMLGFDKASKTIEWLISKSKTSIKQVKESVAASGSGGEGDSEHLQVDETAKNETLKVSKRRTNTLWESSCVKKESREKARERARERTVAKMKVRLFSSGVIDTSKAFSDPNQGTRKNEITSGAQVEGKSQEQEWRSSSDVNIVEKFLGLSSDSSSSSIFKDSEESYTRGTTSTAGMVTPREHNTTSVASVDEERSPISFSLYDYLCY